MKASTLACYCGLLGAVTAFLNGRATPTFLAGILVHGRWKRMVSMRQASRTRSSVQLVCSSNMKHRLEPLYQCFGGVLLQVTTEPRRCDPFQVKYWSGPSQFVPSLSQAASELPWRIAKPARRTRARTLSVFLALCKGASCGQVTAARACMAYVRVLHLNTCGAHGVQRLLHVHMHTHRRSRKAAVWKVQAQSEQPINISR